MNTLKIAREEREEKEERDREREREQIIVSK
jgi:hypothetical protein